MRRCLLSLILVAVGTAGHAAVRRPNPVFAEIRDDPALPRVLLIGDSISIGYTLAVRDELRGVANVHRPPENCQGTTFGLARIDAWLGDRPWDVIHFNWGLHDLKYVDAHNRLVEVEAGTQQASLDVYERQLTALVERLQRTGAQLVFATTTPVPEGARGRRVADGPRYNAVARRIMKAHGIAINDLCAFAAAQTDQGRRPGNVHVPPRTSQRLGERVAAVIRHALGEPLRLEPAPSAAQRRWMDLEMTLFLHFGVNTFTDREWGDGSEDPNVFAPTDLDCAQWVREAQAAGFKMMILTAKHHDGFCLWPSRFTDHDVAASDWRGGTGDVVAAFATACRAAGMQAGFYLSPWDRHDARYGGDAYNDYFKAQLDELMTRYGPFDEVWFDGASKGTITPYDWRGFYDVVYRHNPQAVIAICGPDIRWVGNESGVARLGESSVRDAQPQRHFGQHGPIWYPAECDVSIRPGWFYHAAQDAQVKSVDHLLDIYFKSVGRNSVLLLNVPPDRTGRFAAADVTRLREFRATLGAIFARDLLRDRPATATNTRASGARFAPARITDGDPNTYWATDDGVTSAALTIDLGRPRPLNILRVDEVPFLGERVRAYHVEARADGRWRTVARGTIIGHRNLHRIPPITADRLRLVIDEAQACPAIATFGAYFSDRVTSTASGSRAAQRPAAASNVHPGGTSYGPDKAVDDDPRTRWATADTIRDCWLEVDLGKPVSFDRVRILEFQSRVSRFQIETRLEADSPWQPALTGTRLGERFEKDLDPVRTRWVRLHILAADGPPSIWEFQVFGREP